MHSKSFVWRQYGRFFIVVHANAAPGDEEWDALLEAYRAQRTVRVLVHTENAAPTAAQRVRLTAVFKGRETSIAVLTSSALVRAAAMALRWFRPEIRSFAPADVNAALDYLGATGSERVELARALDELKGKLGLSKQSRHAS